MHRDEARRDGVVSIDELEADEQAEDQEEDYISMEPVDETEEKIRIISDIKVPIMPEAQSKIKNESTVGVEQMPGEVRQPDCINVPTSLSTSLGLVDIVVLEDNQQFILHNDEHLVSQQVQRFY